MHPRPAGQDTEIGSNKPPGASGAPLDERFKGAWGQDGAQTETQEHSTPSVATKTGSFFQLR